MSQFLRSYLATKLTLRRSITDPEKLNTSIRSANVDLNPHQVDSAVFAFNSPLSRGAILADEVGLGKTIEAGLIINQLWVEGQRKILILVPASLRTQWADELRDKFGLDSTILDSKILKQLQQSTDSFNPLDNPKIFIASHNFAYKNELHVKKTPWDLVVIDEAHRMRNVYRKGNKTAKKLRETILGRPKLLLTATPLQNSLMELFGLVSFIDEKYLGDPDSFKFLYVQQRGTNNEAQRTKLSDLRERLMGIIDKNTGETEGGIMTRTLRKQVRGLIPFTNRFNITEDFNPNDDEVELYNSVSDYIQRPLLASTKATQRHMMELVYRKILASSSFAIAGTLFRVSQFLAKRLQKEHKVQIEELQAVADLVLVDADQRFGRKFDKFEVEKVEEVVEEEQLSILNDIELSLDDLEEEEGDAIQDELTKIEEGEDSPKELEEIQEREIDHKFSKEEIISEFKDVLGYYLLATSIDKNQKSQSLIRALKKVFDHAEKKNWPKKAVIFTESRRTQDHLENILSLAGYEDNIILFNGSNAGKKAKDIYQEWANEFPDEAEKNPKSISLRKALVWKFRTLKEAILITTEAGAEGINLQFCNIVVNYDLPWNPQRIEQRIGRCHRYGQELDVLVINFLNKRNYADERVYELLREKIKLFGNLFDFSDKILGTEEQTDDGYEVREIALGSLDSGVGFERKVLNIYQKCRTKVQIEKEFNQLELDLSSEIEEKFENTQRKVIQHFDEEVRAKLRIRNQKISEMLNSFDRDLERYIKLVFNSGLRQIDEHRFEVKHVPKDIEKSDIKNLVGKILGIGVVTDIERQKGVLPIHTETQYFSDLLKKDAKDKDFIYKITFSHDGESKRLDFKDIHGRNGLLSIVKVVCRRKTINNIDEVFEELVFTCLVKDEASWALPTKVEDGKGWSNIGSYKAEKIVNLLVKNEKQAEFEIPNILKICSEENINLKKEEFIEKNQGFIEKMRDQLNQYSDDVLLRFKREMDEREEEIRALERSMKGSKTTGFHERQQIQQDIDKKQRQYAQAVKKHAEMQLGLFNDKDKSLKDLEKKLTLGFELVQLATISFTIES
ncbi:MAG: helicase/type iii restriction enzyme [Microgenomates group bacterium Gr01-1014_5]|nr:MAG: helicase/type iii restriction enzyme [Microgenomates group bacterium Gr01-1014_5]